MISFTLASSAAEQATAWDVALHLHTTLGPGLEPDMMLYSSTMRACQGATQWTRLLGLLDSGSRTLQQNVMLFNVASGIEGTWELPLQLLEFMRCSTTKPDLYTFNSSIRACGKGSWRSANDLLRAAGSLTLTPDVVTYSSLANAWPLAILSRAQEQHVEVNSVIYNASISAMGKADLWDQSLALLWESQHLSLSNSVTVNEVLGACSRSAQWQLAIQLLREATERKLETSDRVSFSM